MVIIIKKFHLILMILVVFLIAACSDKEVQHFSSKEEAFDFFIEKEDIEGNIDLILTKNEEDLLVVQFSEDIYFVAELIEDKEGYYVERISDNVVLGIGAAWELNTADKNKYTIYFNEDKNDSIRTSLASSYMPLSNGEYEMSLVEGHTITNDATEFTNAIKEVEVIKN